MHTATFSLAELQVRLVFEGGYYSGCGFYSNKCGIINTYLLLSSNMHTTCIRARTMRLRNQDWKQLTWGIHVHVHVHTSYHIVHSVHVTYIHCISLLRYKNAPKYNNNIIMVRYFTCFWGLERYYMYHNLVAGAWE